MQLCSHTPAWQVKPWRHPPIGTKHLRLHIPECAAFSLLPGFSTHIARWVTTNLRPVTAGSPADGLRWTFDLTGIAEMYASYEATDMWPLLQAPPEGLRLDFVRAEQSNFRWAGADEDGIAALGHRVHLLRNAGHWVHSDNPSGLFDILAPSFGAVDLHMQHVGMNRR